jgi:transposase
MMPLISPTRLYLYTEATDMRKAFDGLSGLISSTLGRDPLDGSMYIFLNKRRDRMKCLVWDRDGFWLFCKRLERGTFQTPVHPPGQAGMDISYEQLMLILQGIDLGSIRHRPRYSRLNSATG